MAQPKTLRGTYVNILLGDGATPEVFEPICGLNTRSITHQINTNDDFIPDCTNPEDVPTRELTTTGEQWDMSGSGLVDRNNLADLQAAVGAVRNYRFELAEPATDAVYGGYYQGRAVLTNLQITGSNDNKVTIDLTFASDGVWTFVEAV